MWWKMEEGRIISPRVNRPQGRYLALPQKFKAFVAGYRAGKTWIGSADMCKEYWERPLVNQGYFAPTYTIIRDAFFPTIEEVAHGYGLDVSIKVGHKEIHFFSGRQYRGTTICRSMDDPGNIIGFAIGKALIDEIDVLPIDKSREAWFKVMARMSKTYDDRQNGIGITTTPEGFKFTHERFVRAVAENPELAKNYGLVQASTYENEKHLPEDYIPSLKEAYPAALIDAYIDGLFVNLTSGTVYRAYDRVQNRSTETIKPRKNGDKAEPLFIGMDFNVQHMAASIYVQRENGWHLVKCLKDVFDTPEMIKLINMNYASQGHSITVYPDASGTSRKTVDATKSDIALLQNAGYMVRVRSTNPFVKDRINAANKAFEDKRVWVNDVTAGHAAECLERQAYDDNGEPDKKAGFDHQNDATTYPIAYEFPIVRPMTKIKVLGF